MHQKQYIRQKQMIIQFKVVAAISLALILLSSPILFQATEVEKNYQ
jgi:hypothetical protein